MMIDRIPVFEINLNDTNKKPAKITPIGPTVINNQQLRSIRTQPCTRLKDAVIGIEKNTVNHT